LVGLGLVHTLKDAREKTSPNKELTTYLGVKALGGTLRIRNFLKKKLNEEAHT
jgi:hypothetical protein